jgi:hypothetical protein
MSKEVDDNGQDMVANNDDATTKVVVSATRSSDDTTDSEVIKLTPAELDAKIQAAVATSRQEEEERIRREEAERNGEYQVIAEQAQAELRKTNLALWRTKALNKFKLADTFYDALHGETEEEILQSAKKFSKFLEDEVKARVELIGDTTTPNPSLGKTRPITQKGENQDANISNSLRAALGIGQIKQIRH